MTSPRLDLHPRTLRANIWRGLMCASDQEILDGMDFYPGAHGLCRLFSSIYSTPPHPLSPSHIAGIYAALSPMNTWDTNVANILDILRDWSSASVNTTDINFHKALAIRCGADHPTPTRLPNVRSERRLVMPVYVVISETLWETIPILDYGQDPSEPYAIVALVVADTREQARWLAWQTDNSFDGDVRDMPNFRTRKLSDEPSEAFGIVTEWDNYQHFWRHPKAIDLFNSAKGF